MKKFFITILMMLFATLSAQAQTKSSTQTNTQAQPVSHFSSKTYKVEWIIKKTGQVMATKSTVISLNDPENKNKTGKIVFSPQLIQVGTFKYTIGLGVDMKLASENGDKNLVLGVVGNYTDPNALLDLTEKMPDEQNIAHSQIKYAPVSLPNGQVVPLNSATFMKAYDVTSPTGQEVTLTRFIIKDSSNTALNSSLIEISFKVYEF